MQGYEEKAQPKILDMILNMPQVLSMGWFWMCQTLKCQSRSHRFLWFRIFSFIKKETLAQVFSCKFCEISKNTFFTEHLWTTASNVCFVWVSKCFQNICYAAENSKTTKSKTVVEYIILVSYRIHQVRQTGLKPSQTHLKIFLF